MSAARRQPTSAPSLSLVVFAFNEADNVPQVLPEILDWLEGRPGGHELIFVDDGSTDATRAAAAEALAERTDTTLLSHAENRGIGAALKTGVRAAQRPWVTFLPCDGQIAPTELDRLCDAAATGRPSVVFSTYADRDDGLHRTFLSASVRLLIWLLFGVRMRSDGPYLFRRELFDADLMTPDTFFLNFEFPIRVLQRGVAHQTVQIRCLPRRSGQSKVTGLQRIVGVGRDLLDLRWRLLRDR